MPPTPIKTNTRRILLSSLESTIQYRKKALKAIINQIQWDKRAFRNGRIFSITTDPIAWTFWVNRGARRAENLGASAAAYMTSGSEILVRITNDDRLAQDWELVLLAQGLSPMMRRTREGIVIAVPEAEAETALAGLAAYDRENPPKAAERDGPVGFASLTVGIAVAAMIVTFFAVTALSSLSVAWFERGSANADRILAGELWRTVTALTLHGDLAHALSNAVAMALFLGAISGTLGAGFACALVLLAGAGGNLANALLQNPPHVAVGASTAVFGAVGILGSLAMIRYRSAPARKRRAWVPVGAAFALLAMLGTGGARVDIWAHLLGLLVGGGLGAIVASVAHRAPGRAVQWLCGCATLAATVYCWTLAIR